MHQRHNGEPEAVGHRELVLHWLLSKEVHHHRGVVVGDGGGGECGDARVRRSPLVWAEASDNEHRHADHDVGGQHVQPDVHIKGAHEAEETSGRSGRQLKENANAEVHVRLGEVNDALTGVVDGHRGDGQVGVLVDDLPHQAVPLFGSGVLCTVLSVRYQIEFELKFEVLCYRLEEIDAKALQLVISVGGVVGRREAAGGGQAANHHVRLREDSGHSEGDVGGAEVVEGGVVADVQAASGGPLAHLKRR